MKVWVSNKTEKKIRVILNVYYVADVTLPPENSREVELDIPEIRIGIEEVEDERGMD